MRSAFSARNENIADQCQRPHHSLPHFWEEMFGSGRAALVLRQSYLNDLTAVKQITDFKYVRFHAIPHDELGVYNEDEHGNPVYNFAYVDQIYDNLLAHGVRPVIEISFMPKKLAFNPDALHPFWYKQNVSSQVLGEVGRSYDCLRENLVERYGIDEVSQWYFEVWNEPNIDFWGWRAQSAKLLRALRSHRARPQGRQLPASASAALQPRRHSGYLIF